MKQMFDRAMVWGMYPLGVNPMSLVKVRGASLRQKKKILLSQAQVNLLVANLPVPYNLMLLLAAGLGLRVSEVLALQWSDFDFKRRTVTVRRAYTHNALKEAKTEASAATLPVAPNLINALRGYKETAPDKRVGVSFSRYRASLLRRYYPVQGHQAHRQEAEVAGDWMAHATA